MTLVSDVGHYHNKTTKMWECLYGRGIGVALMVSLVSDFVDMVSESSGHPTRMPWHRCCVDVSLVSPFKVLLVVSRLLSPCFPFVLGMLGERL